LSELRASSLPQTGRPRRNAARVPLHEVARAILAESTRPLTAYMLLARLEERLGRHLSPPTVYRALWQLSEMGAVARIESRGAFLSVDPAVARATRMFLLCGACGTATEIEDPLIERRLEHLASVRDFAMARGVIELEGLCGDCEAAEAGSSPL
jgi:Fur family zinc uptake transcriptional regulator